MGSVPFPFGKSVLVPLRILLEKYIPNRKAPSARYSAPGDSLRSGTPYTQNY
jgi:hypothetical protein